MWYNSIDILKTKLILNFQFILLSCGSFVQSNVSLCRIGHYVGISIYMYIRYLVCRYSASNYFVKKINPHQILSKLYIPKGFNWYKNLYFFGEKIGGWGCRSWNGLLSTLWSYSAGTQSSCTHAITILFGKSKPQISLWYGVNTKLWRVQGRICVVLHYSTFDHNEAQHVSWPCSEHLCFHHKKELWFWLFKALYKWYTASNQNYYILISFQWLTYFAL